MTEITEELVKPKVAGLDDRAALARTKEASVTVFCDAAAVLADFWSEVGSVLRERGVET